MPDTHTHQPVPLPRPGTREWLDLAQTGRAPVPDLGADAPTPLPAAEAPRAPGRGAPPGVPSGLGLPKFCDRLTVPPLIRAWRRPAGSTLRIRAELATVRLHRDLPETTAWAYEGSVPGPTIEVMRDQEVRIDWENALVDEAGNHGPAHLPYDVVRVPPLNAPGAPIDADFATAMAPGGRSTTRGDGPDAYPPLPGTEELTAATVVHLHGALTNGHDDGWAHDVALPGVSTRCTYPNRQEATALWYHDHAMAVTRFTVHAGLAGLYLIRDRQELGLRLPSGEREIPLVIADRNLETAPGQGGMEFTGRVLYKQAGFTFGPQAGEIPVTGPFSLVNGTIWPRLDAEARWYRLRVVNGANARVYRLAIHDTTHEVLTPGVAVTPSDPAFTAGRVQDALVVIGTDGGLLPAPVRPVDGTVELGPGERLDLLLDLTAYRGRTLELRNENGSVLNAQPGQADASIMQVVVSPRQVVERFRLPKVLNRDYRRYVHRTDGTLEIGGEVVERHGHAWVAVLPPGVRGGVHPEAWELAELPEGADLPTQDLIQVTRADGSVLSLHPVAKLFDDATTIFVPEGEWMVWNVLHLGGPDHPIHIHMTEFQMLSRRQWPLAAQGGRVPQLDLASGSTTSPLPVPRPGRPVDALSAGTKDTWVVRAGEWVQVLGHFAGATGSFMYHCHILDHEDHTMMRPFVVLPAPLLALHRGHGGGHH